MQSLSDYLKHQKLTQREFAARVGASASFINEIANRRKAPGLDLAVRIERATGGRVPAASWIADDPKNTSASCGALDVEQGDAA